MHEVSHAAMPAGARITRRQLLRRACLAVFEFSPAPTLAACGGTATRKSASTVSGAVINMNDENRFVPASDTVRVGDTVMWRNVGSVAHTATGDPSKALDESSVRLPRDAEPWDSGYIADGQSWSRKFNIPGEYTYFCIPHEVMGKVAFLRVTA